jgi:hypothetical protein
VLDSIKKHHLGFVVSPDAVPAVETKFGKKFHDDKVQGVRVVFLWNEAMGLYEEYLTQEGRAKNYALGFNHICYELPSQEKLEEIDACVRKNKLGFRLTFLERSGSQECGMVCFYKINELGIVEFNIPVS